MLFFSTSTERMQKGRFLLTSLMRYKGSSLEEEMSSKQCCDVGWGPFWRSGFDGRFQPNFFSQETYGSWQLLIGLTAFWLLAFMSVYGAVLARLAEPLSDSWLWLLPLVGVATAASSVRLARLTGPVLDWLCYVFIGEAWYIYQVSGELHIHRSDPLKLEKFCPDGYGTWSDYLRNGVVIRLRRGGIFRRGKVYGHHGRGELKVRTPIFECQKLTVTNVKGEALTLYMDVSYERGRRLAASFLQVVWMDLGERTLYYELHDRSRASRYLELLGFECAKLIDEIQASRRTLGRSKHAQYLRERLEKVFDQLPQEQVAHWKKQSADQLSASEAAE